MPAEWWAHGIEPVGNKAAEKLLKYLDTLVSVPEDLRSGAMHAETIGSVIIASTWRDSVRGDNLEGDLNPGYSYRKRGQ